MSEATFDAYSQVYAETVNASVAPGGQPVEFYARLKVRGLLRTARRLGRPLEEIHVLDVGCGTGLTDSLLAPNVASIDGVDVSSGMIAEATSRNPDCFYQVYDGVRLPFADQSFDVVFAACVLHHVPPAGWDQFVAELWRVTGRPGAAVVIEHNPLNPLTRRAVRACPFDADAVLARPRRVAQAFRRLGVEQLERKFVTFLPFDQPRLSRLEDAMWWLPAGAQYTMTAFRQPPWARAVDTGRSQIGADYRARRGTVAAQNAQVHRPYLSSDGDVAHG